MVDFHIGDDAVDRPGYATKVLQIQKLTLPVPDIKILICFGEHWNILFSPYVFHAHIQLVLFHSFSYER